MSYAAYEVWDKYTGERISLHGTRDQAIARCTKRHYRVRGTNDMTKPTLFRRINWAAMRA